MDAGARVLVVADDLTGALDAAGPFASRGASTVGVVRPEACRSSDFAGAEVVSVATHSRHLPPDEAAARVRDACRQLGSPARAAIKKIDSTLRGQVVAETLAAARALGRPNVVVAPAFPAQGRTVAGGVVRVDGVPLPETGYARDARSPALAVPLDEAFRAAAPGARVTRVGPLRPGDRLDLHGAGAGGNLRILVADAETDDDLDALAAAVEPRLATCLLVGSAGITGAIARRRGLAGEVPAPGPVPGAVLIVAGSRAEATARQVAALAAEPDVTVIEAPDGDPAAGPPPVDPTGVLVLRATAGPAGGGADPDAVAARLAAHAARWLRGHPFGALVATGGDTALAVLDALGVAALRLGPDLAPGIPRGRIDLAGRPLAVVTKAGGFGGPGALVEAVGRLRGG